MTKVAIWGTGSSATELVSELGKSCQVLSFVETVPRGKTFLGLPVLKPAELSPADVDTLFIASMYYPEIVEMLSNLGFPLSKVKIATDQLDDPRYGTLRMDARKVFNNLDAYINQRAKVEEIELFIESHSPKFFSSRIDNLIYALGESNESGLILEFGVYRGETLLRLAHSVNRPVWGFDSFSGFQGEIAEAVERGVPRASKQIPEQLLQYPFLVAGFFEDTLTEFLNKRPEESIAFVHFDAGHLPTARFVLSILKDRLSDGAVLVFDEFIPTPNDLELSEYTAFSEIFRNDDYEIISRSQFSVSIVLK